MNEKDSDYLQVAIKATITPFIEFALNELKELFAGPKRRKVIAFWETSIVLLTDITETGDKIIQQEKVILNRRYDDDQIHHNICRNMLSRYCEHQLCNIEDLSKHLFNYPGNPNKSPSNYHILAARLDNKDSRVIDLLSRLKSEDKLEFITTEYLEESKLSVKQIRSIMRKIQRDVEKVAHLGDQL